MAENKIIYKKLSYEIVECLYEVFNELGPGYQEKYYQKAIEIEFKKKRVSFISQCPYKVFYREELIGSYYIDFVIENKIALEIKKGKYYSKRNYSQIIGYLQASNLQLAILANFTPSGVDYKRVLNINNKYLSQADN